MASAKPTVAISLTTVLWLPAGKSLIATGNPTRTSHVIMIKVISREDLAGDSPAFED